MHARVTAILVARNGADFVERTLGALAAQTRRADSTVFVDAGSTDSSSTLLAAGAPAQLITLPKAVTFGAAVAHAHRVIEPVESEDDWIWLLAHDSAPEPRALEALLAAVEIAPSVAIAGPKLMRWDAPDTIAEYGETVSPFGASLALVEQELDQAQYDHREDVMAVAATGMLIRRSVWVALGGFDRGLPTVDAALDFCIRARLAGHRVTAVAAARVLSSGGPELFGRDTVSGASLARQRRSAQLRRRLVYSRLFLLPLHWLSILPLAILRSILQLLNKRPGAVLGEFAAALVAITARGVPSARRAIARTRRANWSSLAPLRMPWSEVWQHRAHARDDDRIATSGPPRVRVSFFAGGGGWIVVFAAIASAIVWSVFLNAGSVVGGGLAPLSASPADLWSNIGYGWRDIGTGFVGPADPFALVLAVLGSIAFWSPSQAVVGLYVLSLPLAALGAWFCAARFSSSAWAPGVAAIAWAVAPPFLASLEGGRLGATIVHLTLPWLVLAAVRATRSWSASATASLLFALVAASAPALIPALLVMWLAWLLARPTSAHRIIGIPIPAAALFFPLVVYQVGQGNPLAIFADPGVVAAGGTASGTQLAIGSVGGAFNGWSWIDGLVGVPAATAPGVAMILLIPLALLAIVSVFIRGAMRAIPAVVIAVLGLATAVAGAHLNIAVAGTVSVPIWAGAGISLYWFGLVGAASSTIEAIRRGVALPAIAFAASSVFAVLPLLIAPFQGTTDVREGTGRMLPAFVTAEAGNSDRLGTLEILPQGDGSVRALLHRGTGTTLDEQSTIYSTRTEVTTVERRIAVLAGNLGSRSGLDAAPELDDLDIAFILLAGNRDSIGESAERAFEALDGNRLLTPVGVTSQGFLWHYDGIDSASVDDPGPGPNDTATGTLTLTVQSVVFGAALLLAIPTRRRPRVRSRRAEGGVDDPDSTDTLGSAYDGPSPEEVER